MTYVQTVVIPDTDFETFRTLDESLPTTRPAGLLARYVGATPTGLAITAVWASKADSDRFGAEILGPTLRRIHGDVPGGEVVIDFEAVDIIMVGAGV